MRDVLAGRQGGYAVHAAAHCTRCCAAIFAVDATCCHQVNGMRREAKARRLPSLPANGVTE
jgi:hypothetical protein